MVRRASPFVRQAEDTTPPPSQIKARPAAREKAREETVVGRPFRGNEGKEGGEGEGNTSD